MITTTRRTLEQIVHSAEEALSAHAAGEDPEHVLADLEQARDLIIHVILSLKVERRDRR